MALTKEERAKLEELKSSVAAKAISAYGLSPNEAADISFVERIVAKNFAANPEKQLDYLKKKNPNMDFVLKDGEVFAKKAGANEKYKALDPEFSPLSSPLTTLKDLPQDIADIAYDIPAAAAQDAAALAGAIPGVALANAPLAVGGASSASAATAAGAETLRQMLGSALGIEDNISGKDVAAMTAAGAIAPGAGRLATKAGSALWGLGKEAARRTAQFTKEEMEQYLRNFPKVKEAVGLMGESKNLPVAAEQARGALQKMRDTIRQAGLEDSKLLDDLYAGNFIDVDANKVDKFINTYGPTLSDADLNFLSQVKNELSRSTAAVSPPVRGLKLKEEVQPTLPIKPETQPVLTEQGLQSTQVTDELGQFGLFDEPALAKEMRVQRANLGGVSKPKQPDETLLEEVKVVNKGKKELAEDRKEFMAKQGLYLQKGRHKFLPDPDLLSETKIVPKNEKEIEQDLKRYLKQQFESGEGFLQKVERKDQANLARGLQQQLELLQGAQTVPGKTELLQPPPNASKMFETLKGEESVIGVDFEPEQDLLAVFKENATPRLEATKGRRLKQLVQEAADFEAGTSASPGGKSKNRELGEWQRMLNEQLHGISPEAASLDEQMALGMELQKELAQSEKAPLASIKTMSLDKLAALERAAQKTGDTEALDLGNQYRAGLKILGRSDMDDWIGRGLQRKAGRGAARALDFTERASQKLPSTKAVPKSQLLWMELLKDLNEKEGSTL